MSKINNKESLLYSIVSYDRINQQIISISDFVTNCNKSTSISKYLHSIKNLLEQPKIIVTDQSLALINSSLEIFNQVNINQYLNWCFEITIGFHELPEKCKDLLIQNRTAHYICAAHFLKNLIKKVKLVNYKNVDNKYLERAKKMTIFCFTLLQNSTNIKQFEDLLINIFNILNNKFYSSRVKYSLFMIRDQLKYRELNKLKNFDTYEEQKEINDEENGSQINDEEEKFKLNSKRENIKESSPFKHYFRKKIIQFQVIYN